MDGVVGLVPQVQNMVTDQGGLLDPGPRGQYSFGQGYDPVIPDVG